METTLGVIDIELYDDQAPKTVANFLRYAGRGDYARDGFIHRSVPGFIIQGGGFTTFEFIGTRYYVHIPVDPPVQNEFSPSRSNVRGTIAMAKSDGQPDSATSEWFFNLANNSANLDSQNDGFTVFGRVKEDTGPGTGMEVVDAIADLTVCKTVYFLGNVVDPACSVYNSAFTDLPVINYDQAAGLKTSNLVKINRIPNVAAALVPSGNWAVFTADEDMAFDSLLTVDSAIAVTLIATYKSPPNTQVHFNNAMVTLALSGTIGTSKRVITMYDGASKRPTHYYAYGPTPDDPSPHWYDFAFDGETGAEIRSDRIVLHFVDGMRGDDDRTVNDSITHTGAQAVVTAVDDGSAQGGGCSIIGIPPDATRSGDWIVVSLFLAMLALVRRGARTRFSASA